MEYTDLQNLDNTYPQPSNYESRKGNDALLSTGNAQIYLNGIYPEKNKLTFNIPDFSKIKYVPETNFRFILAIFKDYKDKNPVYYTSEKYYKDLQLSYVEKNPYFIQSSFANANIVSYVYEDVIKMVDSMKPLEQKSRIDFRINIFAGVSGSIDYDNLVTYIDWLVDKPSPLDDINFGVLQPETIAGWNALDGNFATGEVKTTVSASYGIGSQFVSIFDSNQLDLEANLKLEQEKLQKIKDQIALFENAIKTKGGYNLPKNLETAYANLDGVIYKAKSDVSLARKLRANSEDVKERQKRITDRLIEEINILNGQKITSEQAVGAAQNKLNAAKKAAEDLVNKAKAEADRLKNIAGDLINKIPKIPKLPEIPKIPNLPSISELGGLLLGMLPQLPALPKLPSLPKKPSFKLPPLKLFKPKKPKEPKKIKKNKGKGLKGAMGDLQDAANSAQKAVGDAQSAAQGAVASAQNVANQATSAVANAQAAVANAQSAIDSGIASAQAAQAGIQAAIDSGKAAVQSTVDSITKI
jgi:hypothetical protein